MDVLPRMNEQLAALGESPRRGTPATACRPPDAWIGVQASGREGTRAAVWWKTRLLYQGLRVGAIGCCEADDAESAGELLRKACDVLRRQGCELAVGPLNGDTWSDYRVVVSTDGTPGFFLEPSLPAEWAGHFREAGFSELQRYFSAVNDRLDRQARWTSEIAVQMERLGVRIRPLDLDSFPEEMERMHAIASWAFARNPLYSPIRLEDFRSAFAPLRTCIDPRLVLLAEHRRQPIGFLASAPDVEQARRGEVVDTLIVKTLAVTGGVRFAGLGYLLLEQVRDSARRLGYRRMIHALVRDERRLRRMTAHFARVFRGYVVYARRLHG